jgi:glycosyltransferase involved in cell wall biosynthesis
VRSLFITYNGLTEPLGRRQVMPYVLGLAEKGWRPTIVSFEKRASADPESRRAVREMLARGGVRWVALTYHRRPTVPATAFDVSWGVLRSLHEARRAKLIHARSTVPALMARTLGQMLGIPWLFDVRGLVAEEYADAGHWRREGTLFRITDAVERHLMRSANGLVFLTHSVRRELEEGGRFATSAPTEVIPCTVDMQAFHPSAEARSRIRRQLGVEPTAPMLVYAGSLGSWYEFDQMLEFFRIARQEIPPLRFLVLTPQTAMARDRSENAGLAPHVVVATVRPDDVPGYLACADAGICFLRKVASKRASSPTKHGEYLASGLAVVSDAWTGDSSRYHRERAWVAVSDLSEKEYRLAAHRLRALVETPARTRAEARALAERDFDLRTGVDRYDALYRKLALAR